MNNTPVHSGHGRASDNEITLKEVILIIWKGRMTVVTVTVLFALISILHAFLSPPVYRATSKLITKTSGDKTSSQLAGIAAIAGISVGAPQTSDPSAYLDDVIRDGEFLRKVLQRKWLVDGDSLLLEQVWEMAGETGTSEARYRHEKAKLDRLRAGGYIKLNQNKRTGLMTLVTSFTRAKLAYDVNVCVLELIDGYIKRSLKSQAKENRRFIESRISEVKEDLETSENELAAFREKNSISGIAAAVAPRLLLEQGRLMRKFEINQELYLQLRKQYEIAAIEEKKDQPLIEIIQNPEVPISRAAPRRKLILLVGILAGLFCGQVIVLLGNWYLHFFKEESP